MGFRPGVRALLRDPDRDVHGAGRGPVVDPFLVEARALAAAAAAGHLEDARMPWGDSTATARLLARWRAELGATADHRRD